MNDSCTRLLSQFVYPILFIVITLLCSFCIPKHRYTIPVSKSSIFNENLDPSWIVHMTDLHISDSFPQAVANSNESFHFIHKYIKPAFLFITGDITDNYVSSKRPCRSYQIETQFSKYHDLIKSSGVFDYAFETIGNHDVVGITKRENDEKRTNYHKYYHINETTVSTARTNRNFRLISFNPVDFTSGTGLMGLVKKIDKTNLDKLEEVVNLACEGEFITVIGSHFTTTTLYPQGKTSSGRTFGELLEKCQVKYFLNGHIHPKRPKTFHHKNGYIEITGIPSKLNEGFAVFTVDNGHSNYQIVRPSDDRPAVLTYPSASVFENEVMKEFSGFVRIISYSNKASQFRATVENLKTKEKVTCDLQFVRNLLDSSEPDSPRLFQCKLSKSGFDYKGTNRLTIEGDLSQTVEFNVDEKLKVTEQHNVLFVSYGFVVGVCLALIYHTALVAALLVPFRSDFLNDYQGRPLLAILLGPVVTGYRLKKLEIWAKIVLPFLVLLPVILPVGFFPSGADRGVIFFWGYLFGSKFTFDAFLVGLAALHFFTVTVAIEEIFIVVLTKWNMSYLVDLIAAALLYAVALFAWYYFGIEVSYGARWFASFPFVLFPAVAVVLAAIHRPLVKRREMKVNGGVERSNTAASQPGFTTPLI